MAALTWRDVAAPSFGGVSQAVQGAGATMDRALTGLSEGLKQFATDRQVGVDNTILARGLQIQDPAKLREALANGSLWEGADLSKVSPKIMQAMDERMSSLLGQASTEQSISSSKTSQAATQQNADFSKQDQTRKVGQLALEDAARPQIAKMMGLSGEAALLSGDDQQKLATTRSNMISARLNQAGQQISNDGNSFNNVVRKRDDASSQSAIGIANDVMLGSATQDQARAKVSALDVDPVTQAKAIKILDDTFGKLYAPVGSSNAPSAAGGNGGGGKPASAGSTPPTVSSPEAREVLSELGRTMAQGATVGAVADVEANVGDKRSAPEVALALSANFPDVEMDELSDLITEGMSANKNLSAADVGSALMRSTTSNFWGSTRFAPGRGVDDTRFKNNLEDMVTGVTDYQSSGNQTVRAFSSTITKADSKLTDAKADLLDQQIRQKSQPDIDISDAEARVERLEAKLQEAVQKYKDTPEFHPVRKEAKKASPDDPKGIQRMLEAGRVKRGG